jgi:hypothetical protein
MRIGSSLAFICIGAILAFAVTSNTPVFNIHTAGWVLMLVGVIGLFLPRTTAGWVGRRLLVRRTYPGGRVEHVTVPPYVARNPGVSVIAAGPPLHPTLAEQGNRDLIDEAEYDTPSSSAPLYTMPIQDTPPDGMPATGYRDGYTTGRTTGRPPVPGVTEVAEDLYEEP